MFCLVLGYCFVLVFIAGIRRIWSNHGAFWTWIGAAAGLEHFHPARGPQGPSCGPQGAPLTRAASHLLRATSHLWKLPAPPGYIISILGLDGRISSSTFERRPLPGRPEKALECCSATVLHRFREIFTGEDHLQGRFQDLAFIRFFWPWTPFFLDFLVCLFVCMSE
jgi:hypothetical protein